MPLELPYIPLKSISMNFIIELLISISHSSTWVIIDYFTKMAHFIPLKDNAKKASDLAEIFVQNI
jgi:hypothetical protein